jgi:hypothetical protein
MPVKVILPIVKKDLSLVHKKCALTYYPLMPFSGGCQKIKMCCPCIAWEGDEK